MNKPGGPIYFVVLNEKTAFFKLEDVFPECFFHREDVSSLEPMQCITSSCPVNHNCMEMLAKRVYVLFEEVLPRAQLLILYYRKRNLPGIGGTIFWRDMREPRNITVNPSAWAQVKRRSQVFKFAPGPHFFVTGTAPPPEESTEEALETT